MAARQQEKKYLSLKGLLRSVRTCFNNVKAPISGNQGKKREISLADSLMSAVAIFSIKYPSLLKFDQSRNKEYVKHNLHSLYGIKQAPSDTYVREQLDEVNPSDLRSAFTLLFSHLQRGKALEKYAYLNGKYILSVDGTGFFSSKKVFCKNCNQKHHRDGSTTYYHQILGASIVHPDHKEVIPICPDPIMNTDGNDKNDCERNASIRLLKDFRREHPHFPVIVVEDALASNAPHIRLLQDLNMDFITVVKPSGNKSLFEWLKGVSMESYSFTDNNGIIHKFNFKNTLPINDSNPDLEVNFLEYWTYNRKGKQTYHNTWITNIPITKNNIFKLAQGGRARWKIENETFNTLKNQGYQFEHNFGHGKKNLSTVFACLMMLAFLIDQTQQMCCGLFQGAWKEMISKRSLWETIRSLFFEFFVDSWADIFNSIIHGKVSATLIPNTS